MATRSSIIMIRLYRTLDSSLADEVEEELQDMTMAYETITVASSAELPESMDHRNLPLVADDEEVIDGREALLHYLDEQRSLLNEWYRFQSDACYIEDDGTIC